jgi:hypothetical protein
LPGLGSAGGFRGKKKETCIILFHYTTPGTIYPLKLKKENQQYIKTKSGL